MSVGSELASPPFAFGTLGIFWPPPSPATNFTLVMDRMVLRKWLKTLLRFLWGLRREGRRCPA